MRQLLQWHRRHRHCICACASICHPTAFLPSKQAAHTHTQQRSALLRRHTPTQISPEWLSWGHNHVGSPMSKDLADTLSRTRPGDAVMCKGCLARLAAPCTGKQARCRTATLPGAPGWEDWGRPPMPTSRSCTRRRWAAVATSRSRTRRSSLPCRAPASRGAARTGSRAHPPRSRRGSNSRSAPALLAVRGAVLGSPL